MKKEIFLEGMHCKHCTQKVKETLENIAGIAKVKVDLNKQKATIKCLESIDNKILTEQIVALGYNVISIEG